jgi:hypothetical protein|tara:strand:- start:115 stop:519 length:405 start_codon:yes stop_codon:yes gene_type:complete
MKHYTKYEETNISIEMSTYETPTHDEYNPKYDKSIKPFRVAYINFDTLGHGENLNKTHTDKIIAFVNIAMIDNITPQLIFKIVDFRVDSFLSESYMQEIVRELADGIKYNEVIWTNNPKDYSDVNSGIPVPAFS